MKKLFGNLCVLFSVVSLVCSCMALYPDKRIETIGMITDLTFLTLAFIAGMAQAVVDMNRR